MTSKLIKNYNIFIFNFFCFGRILFLLMTLPLRNLECDMDDLSVERLVYSLFFEILAGSI